MSEYYQGIDPLRRCSVGLDTARPLLFLLDLEGGGDGLGKSTPIDDDNNAIHNSVLPLHNDRFSTAAIITQTKLMIWARNIKNDRLDSINLLSNYYTKLDSPATERSTL